MKTVANFLRIAAIFALFFASPSTQVAARDLARRGTCRGGGSWELYLSREENGTLEVEFEVETNQAGEDWKVVIRRGRKRIFNRVLTTAMRQGDPSFEARRVVQANSRNKIRAVARLGKRKCVASATI